MSDNRKKLMQGELNIDSKRIGCGDMMERLSTSPSTVVPGGTEHIFWVRQTSTGPVVHMACLEEPMEVDDDFSLKHCVVDEKTFSTTKSINGLPDDLLAHLASFLNVGSLKQARLVNRKFNGVLSQDESGWRNHCERLWSQRLHVTSCMRQDMELLPAKDAYRLSCADARLRHSVRSDDLVFDPSKPDESTVWSFRFKQVAGAEWTNTDPWYAGRDARQLVFLADGSVRQLVYNNKLLSRDFTLQPPFFDAQNLSGGLHIRWRFVTQPIDLPKKESGAYVRLTIAGRDVPTYIVHRSPLGNWGFLMENCWGVFASFSLPAKVVPVATNHIPRMRLRRDSNGGARWLDVSQVESDDEDSEDSEHTRIKKSLLEDDSLQVTCRWQWREALLYNLGASILPDGPNATADFDRAWQLSMRSMQSFGFPVAAQNDP